MASFDMEFLKNKEMLTSGFFVPLSNGDFLSYFLSNEEEDYSTVIS